MVGNEFDVKRSPPGQAFDYRENVGQRQQTKRIPWKRLKEHESRPITRQQQCYMMSLCLCEKKKDPLSVDLL